MIYILELQQRKWYVGRSDCVEKRFQEHLCGAGAAWTRLYPPIRVFKTLEGGPFDEDKVTKELMSEHGIDAVRGGTYVSIELSAEQSSVLIQELRMAADRCLLCGGQGHFAAACREFTSGADSNSYSALYLIGNFFGLTATKTSWCACCNREFVNDDQARKSHEAQCRIYYRSHCQRCGRQGHTKTRCYARSDKHGNRL